MVRFDEASRILKVVPVMANGKTDTLTVNTKIAEIGAVHKTMEMMRATLAITIVPNSRSKSSRSTKYVLNYGNVIEAVKDETRLIELMSIINE